MGARTYIRLDSAAGAGHVDGGGLACDVVGSMRFPCRGTQGGGRWFRIVGCVAGLLDGWASVYVGSGQLRREGCCESGNSNERPQTRTEGEFACVIGPEGMQRRSELEAEQPMGFSMAAQTVTRGAAMMHSSTIR